MAWIRIDDAFDDHPKMMEVGPLGWSLWLAGLAYCNRNLTDGFIPWSAARKLVSWEFLGPPVDARVDASKDAGVDQGVERHIYSISVVSGMAGEDVTNEFVIDLLLCSGLWDQVDGGYQVHDYAQYQPLKAEIEHKRRLKTERQRRWRRSENDNVDATVDGDVDASTDGHVDVGVDAATQAQAQELTAAGMYPDSWHKAAALIREVPGMANVPEVEVLEKLDEIESTLRPTPFPDQALIEDAMRFRDFYEEKRKSTRKGTRWKGWRNAMNNWFKNTRESKASTRSDWGDNITVFRQPTLTPEQLRAQEIAHERIRQEAEEEARATQ